MNSPKENLRIHSLSGQLAFPKDPIPKEFSSDIKLKMGENRTQPQDIKVRTVFKHCLHHKMNTKNEDSTCTVCVA